MQYQLPSFDPVITYVSLIKRGTVHVENDQYVINTKDDTIQTVRLRISYVDQLLQIKIGRQDITNTFMIVTIPMPILIKKFLNTDDKTDMNCTEVFITTEYEIKW